VEEEINTDPTELLENMNAALAEIDAAEIDVDYFYQYGNEEPFEDEFMMIMKRDSTDPAVSSRIIIEPYNRFSGYLLTYIDGTYMAIDSNSKKVMITEKTAGGAERIRKNYRGEIASVFFDKLYELQPVNGTNFLDGDTVINGDSYHRYISVIEDTVTGKSERYIWHIDKETYLPREWSRIYSSDTLNVFQHVTIKSINTGLNPNSIAFDIKYPKDYTVAYDTVLGERNYLLEVGDRVPNFELAYQNGDSFTLDSALNKPTLLKFWGTWCGYCKKSLPLVQNVAQRFGEQINIIGISASEPQGADPQGYLDQNGYDFRTLINGDEVSMEYQVLGFPTVYLIDTNGYILKSFVGFDADLDKKLISTIEENL
jgi:thiol-disulfide isomerase/thioredoxin